MQISSIRDNHASSVAFTRKPKAGREERFIANTMERGYDFIGAEERVAITHGSVFPAVDRNTHIGSPVGESAKKWINFLTLYGFNGLQLGPCGELQRGKTSPYDSSAFAKNRLFIDLKELTTDKWGGILSQETYENVTVPLAYTDKNYEMTNFKDATRTYNTAMSEAFNNIKINYLKGQPQAIAIVDEYKHFLNKHEKRLTEEGVFKVLSAQYGTDEYLDWSDERDISLISDMELGDLKAKDRFDSVYRNNRNFVEQYKFEQFVITRQFKENKEWRGQIGFKYINDLLVGCSKMDAWRHEDAFLTDWEMGAREGSSPSQRWGIKVIDPKKIFLNEKYDLNSGGKFLKEKIDFALEFSENIRVDHVMGLIEPYLLKKDAPDSAFETDPPSVKNKDVEKYISELKNPENPKKEYDEFWDYPKLLEKLVLPAFKEHGIVKDLPVWEDICTYPNRFKMIYSQLDLPGITNVDWCRVEDAMNSGCEDNWFLISSHDNIPTMNYLKREGTLADGSTGEYTRESHPWNSSYLAGYLNSDDSRENIGEIRKNLTELYENDDIARTNAKYSELMLTPKFQFSFDDILGITEEDVVYNIPGTKDPNNWRERISSDFLEKYYENLSSARPTAINFPERLKVAVQAKMDMMVKASGYNKEFKKALYAECQPLLNDLDVAIGILKEKE